VKTAPTIAVAMALSAVVVASGCGSPNRPATWAYLSPVVFQPDCASGSCHSPAAAAAGLDFSTPDRGYTSLTGLWTWIVDPTRDGQPGCGHAAGTIVCEEMFRPLVTPYDPSQSRLIDVLRGRGAPRMPPDRPLDEADIRLVEDWILNGARKDDRAPTDGPPGQADAGATSDADAASGGDGDAAHGDAADGDASDGDASGDAADAGVGAEAG